MLQTHEQWVQTDPNWRTLAALLRLSGGSALLQLWPLALPALRQLAADHERDPRLRLEMFELIVALLEDENKAEAWQHAGLGQQLVSSVLLPGLVWRAGRVPAAVRFAALTAVAALLTQRRLPADQILQLAAQEAAAGSGTAADNDGGGGGGSKRLGLVALLAGCMDEDYEPDTRQLACHTVQLLLDAGARPAAWAVPTGCGCARACGALACIRGGCQATRQWHWGFLHCA